MANIVPSSPSKLSPRESRIAGRALARIDSQTDVGLAKIQQAAELQVERVQAIGYVGQQGMQVVALVSQMEGNLATLVPMATSRLQAVGDLISLEVVDVISQTVRRVSR